ncbi:cytochrome C oxidase copper chaperone-domain-containing protein [Phlyctochytrium arcticum]|nr:cytochrome C oxidase copper chaperone-domain-containing protein [Phlyctochytrium arcticum]
MSGVRHPALRPDVDTQRSDLIDATLELRARGDFSTPLLKAASPSEPSTSLFSSFTSWFSSSSSATPATGPTTPVPAANPNDTPAKPKCKPCCACPETRKKRDECVITFGEEKCEDLIKAHQDCMRAQGFNI